MSIKLVLPAVFAATLDLSPVQRLRWTLNHAGREARNAGVLVYGRSERQLSLEAFHFYRAHGGVLWIGDAKPERIQRYLGMAAHDRAGIEPAEYPLDEIPGKAQHGVARGALTAIVR